MSPLLHIPPHVLPALRIAHPQSLTSTRPFSIATRVRTLARSFEPHPFGRSPKTEIAQKGDWGKQARRLGDAAMFYFPFMGVILAWPLAAEWGLDGRMT